MTAHHNNENSSFSATENISSHKLSVSGEFQTFNVQLATELRSIELAILIQFFINVISVHKRKGKNEKEGRTWNFCTYEDLCVHFPYWSYDQIKRLLKKLKQKNILISKKFNKFPTDQTLWYAFKDEEKWGIKNISRIGRNRPFQDPAKSPDDIPLSTNLTTSMKDNVSRTLPSKYQMQTMAPEQRFKLKVEQQQVYLWLKDQGINTEDKTLCYWAKNYDQQRLSAVVTEAKDRKPKNLGAYINKLLKTNAGIGDENIKKNIEFAKCFIESNGISSLVIDKKCIKMGSHWDLSLNIDPNIFAQTLLNKF
jgi:hypothetical protein